ncbi:MAG: DNA recombination protein RmuC [Opitutales bacterium]|nr:DNA recombination protein RmuC [Opitutales bacterium]
MTDNYFIILYILFLVPLAAVFIWEILRLRASLSRLRASEADLRASEAGLRARAQAAAEELSRVASERDAFESANMAAQKNLAAAAEKVSSLESRLKERAEQENALREKLTADFQNLSNRIFDSAREKLVGANLEQMGLAIAPLKASISEFRAKLEALGDAEARNNASMAAHIETLVNANRQIGERAESLATALRSNNKVAGNWGETVLERVFESCGFVEGVHYKSQKSYRDADGAQKRLMPDFVVYLPDSRSIVVDSKLSLVDYADYSAAESGEQKRAALAKFKRSAREHLLEFEGKYNNLPDVTCGFKVMFMPIESAYQLLLKEDPKLISDAFDANVLIAGPASVMAVLKIAEIAHRNAAFEKNIREICRVGSLLQKRIEIFARKFDALGAKIDGVKKEYDGVRTTLDSGSQSLMLTAQKFAESSKSANMNFEEELENEDEGRK